MVASSNIPPKIPAPFAESAAGTLVNYPIPDTVSAGSGNASWAQGFGYINAEPTGSGGIPPFVQDFNGTLQQISAWAQWYSMGGPIYYDNTFSGVIGGYPAGAVVYSTSYAGQFWQSETDNNTTDPDIGGAGWLGVKLYPVFTYPDPVIERSSITLPSANSTYTVTSSIVAPCNGFVTAVCSLNLSSQSAGIIAYGMSFSGAGVTSAGSTADGVNSSQTQVGKADVSAGSTVTLVASAVTQSTAPGVDMTLNSLLTFTAKP
jgi:hypothetical protein